MARIAAPTPKNRDLPKQGSPKKGTARVPSSKLPEWKDLDLLQGVFADEAGRAFRKLLKWLGRKDKAADPERGRALYRKLGTGLQDYWLERFLDDGNLMHRKAERASYHQIGLSLKDAYEAELADLLVLLRTDWEMAVRRVVGRAKGVPLPSFADMKPLRAPRRPSAPVLSRFEIKEKLLDPSRSASELLPEICAHFAENGFGPFGRHRSFRWDAATGALEGTADQDPIRLENLVGYDEQRKPLVENVEACGAGRAANNVLVYGERGTGKSSTVKALLNAYQDKGLRLVEVSASDLMHYPRILKPLRDRRERFILFVDDLSFEGDEASYRGLKALLEGSVEPTPPNVILIATSNRKHLVKEYFAERDEGVRKDGEVHGQDTVEEKLSLADRFGLVVSFYAPDQDTYLRIVESWAKEEGVRLPAETLRAKALLWARQNNGPSGRTARQFVTSLKGKG
jgi:predicted AAA+ superfamily ATPase